MQIEKMPGLYSVGTASVEAGSVTVTPTDALWSDNVWGDDLFFLPSQPLVPPQRIAEINDDGTATLAYPWPGADADEEPYEIRYVGIIERSTAQTRKVLEQLGEISAYFDVQVNTLADRAAFDARPSGYRVLVSDVGDGRAEIFSKMSSVAGDWSDGAPLGEIGPEGPRGPSGITWRGSWDGGTVYAAQDGVLYNGSSWRAKQANTNQAPPALPAIENTYWHLVSQAGVNGTGTGDVLGLASSVSGRIVIWSGTSGKQLGQSGLSISDLQPAGNYEPARTRPTTPEKQTGVGTTPRGWAPEDVAQAILSLSPSPADLEFTVSQLAILMADANNQAQFLGPNGNRFADSFDALTYVDVVGSTNLDSSVGGLLKATSTTPRVSGATPTVPLGGTASAINDDNPSTTSTASPGNLSSVDAPGRIVARLDFGAVRPFSGIEVKALNGPATTTGRGEGLYYSTDGVTYTRLGAETLITGTPVNYVRSGNFNARYIAYVASADNFGAVTMSIGDLNALGPALPANLTTRSTAFTAAAVPTRMKALVNVREVEAAVAGTDYLLDCSRDGGATWTAMALTERYTSGNLRVVEAAETDVSGQPSGMAPRWRFRTLNNKNVELHDVYLYWS